MPYAHAAPGERCANCNDYAVRIVGTQALCLDHFDNLVGAITRRVRARMLTPPETALERPQWRQTLTHGVTIGVITANEARDAWSRQQPKAA